MASSYPEVNLTRAKELGKYNELTGFSSGNGKPHEKSRVLAAQDVEIIRKCEGCGKNMSKVKDSFVCSCKLAIHCSKSCFKTSNHKCEELSYDKNVKVHDVLIAWCDRRYGADREDNKGPSSEKITSLLKTTKGVNHKILNYADRGIATAAYVVGSAYMEREFERGTDFTIPRKYEEQSVAETNEIAVKYLKMAAEGDIPEAMYCLFRVLVSPGGLRVDRRVAHLWLDKAYNTGRMDYLIQILQTPTDDNFPEQFSELLDVTFNDRLVVGPSLAFLLMATRFRELKAWDGKTGMGQPFYGFPIFQSIVESIGELKNEQSRPSFIEGEKKTILVISARLGFSDMVDKSASYRREENNVKFLHGTKGKVNPDYQLVGQTSNVDGRTNYLISCKHNQVKIDKEAEWNETSTCLRTPLKKSLVDISQNFKRAGECQRCVQESKQRLRAVSLGVFSISTTPLFGTRLYVARYAKVNGVIVQDVFSGHSKPDMRQLLQCLMSNPADLHPLAIAEDANIFWPIIWFWGSVYEAVRDSCDKTTLDAIYCSLGDKVVFPKSSNASALAAFPEAAAGEWRIACGNENCVRVDHEVKMSLCAGCKVRRYCNEACQSKDWEKHKQFCKAGKK